MYSRFLFLIIVKTFLQVLQITDTCNQSNADTVAGNSVTLEVAETTVEANDIPVEEARLITLHEEQEEINNTIKFESATSVEEAISDEGWQEANTKGRSSHNVGRKLSNRRPALPRLNISNSDYSNVSSRKLAPRVTMVLAPSKQEVKAAPTIHRVPTSPATPVAIASKSLSYKQVALAPPGTVLKPLLEKKVEEDCNDGKVEIMQVPASEEEDETTIPILNEEECPKPEEKSAEPNGSKLSAAAEPFNPGMMNPVPIAVTSIYDVRVSQEMLSEPMGVPSVAARVPCGPRSPLYYRGFGKYQARNGPRIMNPHAPEYIPKKVLSVEKATKDDSEAKSVVSSESEKAEFARQILLSFIVKSVKNGMEPTSISTCEARKTDYVDSPSEAIANDSAIIKILYGKEVNLCESSSKKEPSSSVDGDKKGDGEGFTLVRKRKKNRQQFPSGVSGLYNQQSICASVR